MNDKNSRVLLSKREARVFLEITKNMNLDDVILITDHPGRPFFRGVFLIAYASAFYENLFELANLLHTSNRNLICEIAKSDNGYLLDIEHRINLME